MSARPHILITGASGQLGGETLEFLMQRLPPSQIAALARDPIKLATAKAQGVDVRRGDYFDYQSLLEAFQGIEKLFLVSAVAFSDRDTQEGNAIDAAKEAGVKHIFYSSIQKKPGSEMKISMATETNDRTEEKLRSSGMSFTILRNSLYIDSLKLFIGENIFEEGIQLPTGSGKAALATHKDMAEGIANILAQSGHENKIYTLGASEAFSLAQVAETISEATGKAVKYKHLSLEQYIDKAVAAGMPQAIAAFSAEWLAAIASDEFAEVTKDLERLLGRPPQNYREFFTK